MLDTWLICQERNPCAYKFKVVDISELVSPNQDVVHYIASALLAAHGDPEMIREEYEILADDAAEVNLDILRNYINSDILPTRDITKIGNFGEILVTSLLVELEGFWFPIYKLRYREKRNWSMRLTDLCLFHMGNPSMPLVCYGEVKTKSSGHDLQLAVKGHESIGAEDALSNSEVLRFIATRLREAGRMEEYQLITKIRLDKITYNKRHELFLVHNKEKWKDDILDTLNGIDLDPRLRDFSVRVLQISELRSLIDSAYELCTVVAGEMVSG